MFRTRLAVTLAFVLSTPIGFANGQAATAPDIDKVNGSITAEPGQSYGSLETVNGGIHIEAGARTGNAETVNGGIHVADRAQTGSLETVNGGIRLGTQVQSKGLETVNGEIFVDRGGQVRGGVTTVNGAIGLVDTDVEGGIDTVNGDVTVGIGSHVKGGLKVEKPGKGWLSIHFGKRRPPHIVIGPNAVVDGPMVFEREVVLYVSSSARTGPITGATAIRFDGPRAPSD